MGNCNTLCFSNEKILKDHIGGDNFENIEQNQIPGEVLYHLMISARKK